MRSSSRSEAVLIGGVALAVRLAAYLSHWVPSTLFPLIAWSDFSDIYLNWMKAFASGAVPYLQVPTYTYTPLFAGVMFPFYLAGVPQAPFLLADAASAALVFLIVRSRGAGEVTAVLAGLSYALSPLAAFNEGTLLLSAQPMELLILASVYLFLTRRAVASSAVLALAVMTRQEAALIVPVFVAWYALTYRKQVSRGAAWFLIVVGVASLPFAWMGATYFGAIDYANGAPFLASSFNSTGGFTMPVHTLYQELQLSQASLALSPMLAAVLLYFVTVAALTHRRGVFIEGLAASLGVGLTVISGFGLPVFAYYYLPGYALLAASSRKWTWTIPIAFQACALYLAPDAAFQNFLFLLAVSLMLALGYARTRAAAPGPGLA